MIRKVGLALVVALVAVVSFVGWIFFRPVAPVTVVIVNASSKPIDSVTLKHEHGFPPIWTTVRCPSIPVGGKITVHFPVTSEASYQLLVHFHGDTPLVFASVATEVLIWAVLFYLLAVGMVGLRRTEENGAAA